MQTEPTTVTRRESVSTEEEAESKQTIIIDQNVEEFKVISEFNKLNRM